MWIPRRYKSFRDDDGSIQWFSVRSHLRSRIAVARMRLNNRRQDLRAVLAGACNASTWDPSIPGYHAYSHWRCGKAKGHPETTDAWGGKAHRFNNYIWEGPGSKVEYSPLPVRNAEGWFDTSRIVPFRKLADGRHAVCPRRESRIMAEANRAWTENRSAQRRRPAGAARPD